MTFKVYTMQPIINQDNFAGSGFIIPFLKNGFALQVFVKCNLIRHKLTVCATKKRHLQLEMVLVAKSMVVQVFR